MMSKVWECIHVYNTHTNNYEFHAYTCIYVHIRADGKGEVDVLDDGDRKTIPISLDSFLRLVQQAFLPWGFQNYLVLFLKKTVLTFQLPL